MMSVRDKARRATIAANAVTLAFLEDDLPAARAAIDAMTVDELRNALSAAAVGHARCLIEAESTRRPRSFEEAKQEAAAAQRYAVEMMRMEDE